MTLKKNQNGLLFYYTDENHTLPHPLKERIIKLLDSSTGVFILTHGWSNPHLLLFLKIISLFQQSEIQSRKLSYPHTSSHNLFSQFFLNLSHICISQHLTSNTHGRHSINTGMLDCFHHLCFVYINSSNSF